MPMVRSHDLDAGMLSGTRDVRGSWSTHGLLRTRTIVKHTLDRVAALAGLLVTAPLLAAVALAVALRDDGPVLRRDERLGQDGRTIGVLSFWITDEMCESRAWRLIDRMGATALPQLWNVLCGELSLVGPRPRPLALTPPPARPGLTGLAQVEQLTRPIPLAERYALDARYADSWSLALDARIVARTMWRVVRRA
jgi:lipopolysaccharide/colanic/teichoic acid biosynthesis glycosyltransferase